MLMYKARSFPRAPCSELEVAALDALGVLGDVGLALRTRSATTILVIGAASELELARALLLRLAGLVHNVLLRLDGES